ncbi:Ca2+:H+ antiporter [Fusarium coicis]|nr:Ca2+:H+ antiporter [Fusarium coicis]
MPTHLQQFDPWEKLASGLRFNRGFIGLMLNPIVGNGAEHVTAVVVAFRDKMDLSMSVAVGSSIKMALLFAPSLLQPSVLTTTVQTVAFAVSALVVIYTIQDGKSNYLEGAMLMGLYIIIASAFYVTPYCIMNASK